MITEVITVDKLMLLQAHIAGSEFGSFGNIRFGSNMPKSFYLLLPIGYPIPLGIYIQGIYM